MKKTVVTSVGNVGTKECSPPRWRAMNVEGVKIDDPVGSQGGVLCDSDGLVQALWLNYSSQNDKGKDVSFMSGLPVSLVRSAIEPFQRGEKPKLRGLDIELWTMRIAAARTLGLTDSWVRKIEGGKSSRHTLLYVLNILDTSSPCAKVLKVGDIVLEINGQVVTRMGDLAVLNDLEAVEMVRSCHSFVIFTLVILSPDTLSLTDSLHKPLSLLSILPGTPPRWPRDARDRSDDTI